VVSNVPNHSPQVTTAIAKSLKLYENAKNVQISPILSHCKITIFSLKLEGEIITRLVSSLKYLLNDV
jgi:hypothetical protein